jgi:hypothetical protein
VARLKLHSIFCKTTEDNTGADEPYLLVGNRKIWGSQSMNDNESEDLTMVPEVAFTRSIRLSLYDQDSGFFDKDDFLGSWVVWAGETGTLREARFNGDGADYTITYEVFV